jgi:hypothetical protein
MAKIRTKKQKQQAAQRRLQTATYSLADISDSGSKNSQVVTSKQNLAKQSPKAIKTKSKKSLQADSFNISILDIKKDLLKTLIVSGVVIAILIGIVFAGLR